MTDDDKLLSISGIQHFVYCRRQWALIHIEQQWEENVLTVSGELMHQNAHDSRSTEKRGNLLVSRGMAVTSRALGLTGVCDVVEFHKSDEGALLHGQEGYYRIVPVEYKHGKPKDDNCDILQAAAQAMCLEEMFCTTVDEIHIFYGKTRHRLKLTVSSDIRIQVKNISSEMHDYMQRQYTPKVKCSRRCNACSLKEICLPKMSKTSSVKRYIANVLGDDAE